MQVTQSSTAPPPSTRDELIAARGRYEARIPAQDMRVAVAARAVAKAQAALDAAKAEQAEAIAAKERLTTYIADLTAQIGA